MTSYSDTRTGSRLDYVRNSMERLPQRLAFLFLTAKLRPEIIRKYYKVERLFVVYPETERYADAFTFPWMRNRYMIDKPWIGGLYRIGGKWGVTAVIYTLPREFKRERLEVIHRNVTALQQRIGAKTVSYAGNLPSKMRLHGIRDDSLEAYTTAVAVAKAVKQIRQGRDHLVVLLGGNGHTGQVIQAELRRADIPIVVVDLPKGSKGSVNYEDWPISNSPRSPYIILNLIGGRDLQQYDPLLRPKDILINEAYPAPRKSVIQMFMRKGIVVYHVVGIKPDFCLPSFPGEYEGGVPCCGAILSDSMEVIVGEYK